MSAVPALIIAGPGTNRDRDLALAFELAGATPTIVLVNELIERPELLTEARMLGIAGGFSYGDALGAGRMMALDLSLATAAGMFKGVVGLVLVVGANVFARKISGGEQGVW